MQATTKPVSTPRLRPALRHLLLALALLLHATAGAAESPPAPVTIEADSAVFDEARGESIYSGNVVITRAGIQIQAARVTVYNHGSRLQRLVAEGDPVRFQLQREGQEDLNGAAQRLDYAIADEHLLLQDQAWVTQGRNRFSGQRIEYDMRSERVVASQGADGSQRVRVTIHPQDHAPASDDGGESP